MKTYTSVPKEFVIGDSLILEIDGGEYPAPDWSLTLSLVSTSGRLDVTSVADGTSHQLVVDTSSLSAGRYDYQLQATGDGYRVTIGRGDTTALADLGNTDLTSYDGRSHVKKTLDALEAAIEGRASKTQLVQKVADMVEVQHLSPEQQTDWRDKYLLKYKLEQAMAKGGTSGLFTTITPRFRS